jgi:hypothetical protein
MAALHCVTSTNCGEKFKFKLLTETGFGTSLEAYSMPVATMFPAACMF